MMRCFLFSLSVIFIAACSTRTVQLQPALNNIKPVNFNWDSTLFYRANISVMGKDLSGIIVFNKNNDTSYRLIMTNDVGPKLIDMTIMPGKYVKNYAVNQLDKKIVMKQIWEDFGTALGLFSFHKSGYNDPATGTCCFSFAKNFSVCYHIVDSESFPANAGLFEHGKKKTTISYFCKTGHQPDSIKIEHLNFNMSYFLRKFK